MLSEAFEMFSTPEEHRNLARRRPCLPFSFIARGLGALFFEATATLGIQVQPFDMSPEDASVPGPAQIFAFVTWPPGASLLKPPLFSLTMVSFVNPSMRCCCYF